MCKACVEYFRNADPTFTLECTRARLQELVLGFCASVSLDGAPAF
jgi:hypothetical protein